RSCKRATFDVSQPRGSCWNRRTTRTRCQRRTAPTRAGGRTPSDGVPLPCTSLCCHDGHPATSRASLPLSHLAVAESERLDSDALNALVQECADKWPDEAEGVLERLCQKHP